MTDSPGNDASGALRVGLLAAGGESDALAQALGGCPDLQLSAAAGMPASAAPAGARWFDDMRVMIAQGELQAIALAHSPRAGIDLGNQAIARGLHVWRTPPMGREFAECVDMLQTARAAGRVCRVASWWDHVGPAVSQLVRALDAFRPVYSEVLICAAGPGLESWRSSQIDAGGGVLATDAYPHLEALIALRGLPEAVFAQTARCRRTERGLRETEDIALATLRYPGGGLALIRAAWDLRPFEGVARHHGPGATVELSLSRAAAYSVDGALLGQAALPADLIAAELAAFARAAKHEADRAILASGSERHLAVMAMLEAMYLSARTGQPESPRKLYEVHRWPIPPS